MNTIEKKNTKAATTQQNRTAKKSPVIGYDDDGNLIVKNPELAAQIDEITRRSGITVEDFVTQAIMEQGKGTTTMPTKRTTIELDADTIAKIRASLRAIRSNETAEQFITGLLQDMLTPISGFFECANEYESRQDEIEAKLDRIRQGDARLVRSEPLPLNAGVHPHHLPRLHAIAQSAGGVTNSILNTLLAGAMDKVESGEWTIGPGEIADN